VLLVQLCRVAMLRYILFKIVLAPRNALKLKFSKKLKSSRELLLSFELKKLFHERFNYGSARKTLEDLMNIKNQQSFFSMTYFCDLFFN
jgi:hypothetical protein